MKSLIAAFILLSSVVSCGFIINPITAGSAGTGYSGAATWIIQQSGLSNVGSALTNIVGSDGYVNNVAWDTAHYFVDGSSVAVTTSSLTLLFIDLDNDPATKLAGNANYYDGANLPAHYSIQTAADGTLNIWENSDGTHAVFFPSVGSYIIGDVLKIAIVSGTVTYYKNASVLQTSTLAIGSYTNLAAGIQIYSNGGTTGATNIVVAGTPSVPGTNPNFLFLRSFL